MIMACEFPRETGKIYTAEITDTEGKYVKVTFLVIREATQKEYLENILEVSNKYDNIERVKNTKAYNARYFYEISTD